MNQQVSKRRAYITGLIILLISAFFIIKLSQLHFSKRISAPAGIKFDLKRGYITDRNGALLALSIETDSLFANPEKVKNISEIASILSPIINVKISTLKNRLSRKKRFIWLKRKLGDNRVKRIKKIGIKVLYFKKEYNRVYPYESLASNIIGFVGIDNTGLEGIEYSQNRLLSGFETDDKGLLRGDIKYGLNIRLTIDRNVQYFSEMAVRETVKKYKAKQGAAVVIEIRTGRILAIAKYPRINPNRYYNYNSFSKRNFTIIDSFEPGSTFKLLTAASLLENVKGILNKKFICKGKIEIFDTTINDTGVHGIVDLKKSIRFSCNVGMIESVKKLKKRDFYSTLQKFGFGKTLKTGMPGEAHGILRSYKDWSGLSKYSISIGHEISVTSIQMAAAISAIANDGIYIYPSIIESIEKSDGTIIRSYKPRIKGRVLKKEIAGIIQNMMKDVVLNGTGKRAASKYYKFSGKTGTSKKFSRKGGYYSDRVISSFIGIAPSNNPEVCIYVVIDEPEEKESGGKIAAPLFREIAESILPQLHVKDSFISAVNPKQSRKEKRKFDGVNVPDFNGLGLSESVRLLSVMQKRKQFKFILRGTGQVYRQKPAPGEKINPGDKIILFFKND